MIVRNGANRYLHSGSILSFSKKNFKTIREKEYIKNKKIIFCQDLSKLTKEVKMILDELEDDSYTKIKQDVDLMKELSYGLEDVYKDNLKIVIEQIENAEKCISIVGVDLSGIILALKDKIKDALCKKKKDFLFELFISSSPKNSKINFLQLIAEQDGGNKHIERLDGIYANSRAELIDLEKDLRETTKNKDQNDNYQGKFILYEYYYIPYCFLLVCDMKVALWSPYLYGIHSQELFMFHFKDKFNKDLRPFIKHIEILRNDSKTINLIK